MNDSSLYSNYISRMLSVREQIERFLKCQSNYELVYHGIVVVVIKLQRVNM